MLISGTFSEPLVLHLKKKRRGYWESAGEQHRPRLSAAWISRQLLMCCRNMAAVFPASLIMNVWIMSLLWRYSPPPHKVQICPLAKVERHLLHKTIHWWCQECTILVILLCMFHSLKWFSAGSENQMLWQTVMCRIVTHFHENELPSSDRLYADELEVANPLSLAKWCCPPAKQSLSLWPALCTQSEGGWITLFHSLFIWCCQSPGWAGDFAAFSIHPSIQTFLFDIRRV